MIWLENGDDIIKTRIEYLNYNNKDALTLGLDNRWNVDWSIEPIESIQQLCYVRALQLRETYDHIILYYSGGPDSSTVLQTFREHNIPLDEVVFYQYSDVGGLGTETAVSEKVENLNVVNITYKMLNTIFENELWEKENYNFSGLIHNFARFRIDFFEKLGHPKRVRKGKVCHLIAGIYPSVRLRPDETKDSYWFESIIGIRRFLLPCGTDGNVQFFTTPDLPKLHIKQSHILAKYLWKLHGENLFNNNYYTRLEVTKNFITESVEEKRKSGIRDFPNIPFKSYLKNGGELKNMFNAGTECREILDTYGKDKSFIDKYKYSISPYRIEVSDMNRHVKSFRLFEKLRINDVQFD